MVSPRIGGSGPGEGGGGGGGEYLVGLGDALYGKNAFTFVVGVSCDGKS